MKYLKHMIEHVKVYGVRVSDTVKDFSPGRPDKESTDLFFHLVEKCQPFVLFQKNTTPEEIISEEDEGFDPNTPITDAPFQVYSLEMFGDSISISIPKEHDMVKVYCDCLLAYEVSPMKFLTFAFTKYTHPTLPEEGRMVMLTAAFNDILKDLTTRINREECGFKIVAEKVKIGTGKDKRFHKFKKIVYIKPRADKLNSSNSFETPNINWTHRWMVRGHWRQLIGIGKDREGSYCIEGHTWVSEHSKGPEDQPLVQKVRIVK